MARPPAFAFATFLVHHVCCFHLQPSSLFSKGHLQVTSRPFMLRKTSKNPVAMPKLGASGMHMACDVSVVGSLNYDQFAYVGVPPKPGETIYGKKFVTGFGGKGANQCVMAAKLGVTAAMIGALGSDDIAEITISNMASQGVDINGILLKDGVASGVAPITVGEDGQNSIIICPGANLELTPADVESQKDNEVPPKTTLKAMQVGKGGASGPLVILNAAPAPELGTKWEEGQWENLEEMVGACDVLCINESEAEKISGVSMNGGGDLDQRLRQAAMKLLAMGAQMILFTLGGEGSCLVKSPDSGVPADAASLKMTRVLGPEGSVKVVDTSGAGDCFLGALAAYVAQGSTLEEAMAKAGKVATISVTKSGTQTSYPDLASLPVELLP